MKRLLSVLFLFSFLFLLSNQYNAQSNVQFESVGAKVGYIMPSDGIDNTIGINVNAGLGTLFTPDFHFGAFIEYWGKTYSSDNGFNNSEVTWSSIVVAPQLKYHIPMENSSIRPYAGAGLGLQFWSVDYSSDLTDDFFGFGRDASTSGSALAIFFLGGIEFPLSPNFNGVAELKYTVADADYFGIFAGVQFYLDK